MSVIVTTDDLGVYLGLTVDEDRAQMLIDDAIAEALTIVTVGTVPVTGATEANLPATAASVIRAAVGRIYLNPAGVTNETVGIASYGRSAGTGAMFSKAERAKLRRGAGGGNAFSIDLLPKGVTQVESLTVTATAGTYLLGLFGVATAPINWNAPLSTLQATIEAHPLIGAGNIIVSGTVGAYVLTFAGRLTTTPVPVFTVDTTGLTGTAVVAVVTAGVFAPAQGLPWWDRNITDPFTA